MNKFLCLVIILALFITFPAFAEKYTARQLVDHLYVTGGQLPINDMMIVMDIYNLVEGEGGAPSMMQQISRDKVFFKAPNKLRVDSLITDKNTPLQGKLITIIRNGVMRFMYISLGEFPIKKEKDTPTPSSLVPFNIQKYPSDTAFKYVYLGNETINNKKIETVGIIKPEVDPRENLVKVWIDTDKWIPVKVEMKKVVKITQKDEEGKEQKVEKVFSKVIAYEEPQQLKDGRWMPFVLKIYFAGELISKVVYSQVGVNAGLQDDLFEPMKPVLPEGPPVQ